MSESARSYISRKLKTMYGLAAMLVVSLAVVASPLTPSTGALSATSNQRDCDNNAVIRCGALSTQELQQKFDQPGVREIFNYFGINGQEVRRMDSTAQLGHVTSDGRVIVNGETVATNAMTAGRQNIPGSTPVTYQGVQFYTRPPSIGFSGSNTGNVESNSATANNAAARNANSSNNQAALDLERYGTTTRSPDTNRNNRQRDENRNKKNTNQTADTNTNNRQNNNRSKNNSNSTNRNQRLEAFVVMNDNGRFRYAVLTSCGNPVIATPRVERPDRQRPQPQPKPAPEQPAQTKKQPSSTASASASASATAVVTTPAPQTTPTTPAPAQTTPAPAAPAPVPAAPIAQTPAASTLPKTGVEQAAGIIAIAIASGTLGHLFYTRRKLTRHDQAE